MVWGSLRFINRELSKCILLKLLDITVQCIFFSETEMAMSNAVLALDLFPEKTRFYAEAIGLFSWTTGLNCRHVADG